MSERIHGRIKTLLADKGCGFIRADDGEDFFFHRSGLEQTTLAFPELEVGMPVDFEAVPNAPKGPRAISVRVVQ